MKKASIIGLLIVGLIFQNCKNDKAQPAVLSDDDTETVVEQEDAIKVNETEEVEKEISSDSVEWIVPINFQTIKTQPMPPKRTLQLAKLYIQNIASHAMEEQELETDQKQMILIVILEILLLRNSKLNQREQYTTKVTLDSMTSQIMKRKYQVPNTCGI